MSIKSSLGRASLMMLGIFVLLAIADFSVFAQNIRLRSNLDPVPGSTSNIKYADITADGNLAVMGSYGTRGAYIFDVSNPDAPVLKAWYNPSPQQQFLEAVIVGNRAYFGSGNGDGVHIVDLSNPSNPVLLGKINPSTVPNSFSTIHEITVDGDYLYENLNNLSDRRIKVINISNPAQPVFVRDITPNDVRWIHAVHIRNGKMYTSGWGDSSNPGLVEIYDITNIEAAAPRLLGQVASGTNTHSTWTSEDGNYLYVCREFFDGELRVYDIRNVAQPVLTKVIKAADLGINAICPHNPMVKGDKLYVGWYQAGLQVFDLANPADPKRVGQFDTYTPQFVQAEAEKQAKNLKLEPWDMVCGSESLANVLPNAYNGNWTAFPLLGADKVLLSDLAFGLYIVDASRVSAAPRNSIADFDGDGKTDFSTYTRSNGFWQIESSSNAANTTTQFGIATDVIRPGDFDGDGKADITVFRDGNWYSLNSSNNSFRAVQFGQTGDIPVSADYDSDGKTDPAVWRPANGTWYALRSTLGFYGQQWGTNGDEPVVGDFDGDGKADLTVARSSNGYKFWYTLQSSSSILQATQFGLSSDKTVVADFDGDQKTDIAVFRAANGTWYISNSSSNTISGVNFGISTDLPIPADYDGDGKSDIAVYRSSNNTWYGLRSSNGSFFARQFGSGNDLPAPCFAQSQGCVIQ
ncbi:MAG: FG-GAP-like repeat-containing protein [Pyrinomonadaceae bacterium]